MCSSLALAVALGVALVTVPDEDAGDRLQQAVNAYGDLNFARAIELLQPLLTEPGLTPGREATIRIYLGCIWFSIGERQRADEEFSRTLRLAPEAHLPESTSPKIVGRFEELRRVSAARDSGANAASLDVVTEPSSRPPTEPGALQPGPAQESPVVSAHSGRLWTWIAGGTGAVALASGGGLAVVAWRDARAADRAVWAKDAQRLSDRAGARAVTSQVLLGTASLVLLGAVALYFVEGMTP
jgi:hypothetical protein